MQDTILRLCASTALVGVLAFPAGAQQIINLEEITFSANLVPTPIGRSGSSVNVQARDEPVIVLPVEDAAGPGTAPSAQLIAGLGASAPASDLLRRVPGVSLSQAGPTGTTSTLRIRGAGPKYTAVFVDGVRVDDPTGLSTQFDFGALGVTDIGRIEVLRGSQSALYGGSAVAGVVNITSRRPDQDGFSQTANAEIGSNKSLALTYGMFFRDERIELALNLARRQTDGFSAWEGPLPAPNGLEKDGFESNRLSFSARYKLTDELTVGLSAFAQRSIAEYDGYGNAAANNESRRREAGGRIFAEYDLGSSQHELSLGIYDITRREFAGGVANGWFKGGRTSLKYQGQTQLDGGFALVWGLDTTEERGEFKASLAGQAKMRTSGAFAQLLWSDDDRLDLSATLRVDRNSDYGNFVTGRLAGSYALTDNLILRGAVARGFTPPSVNQRFGADYGFSVVAPNPALEPETSRSYELGADMKFGAATVSATLFQLDTDNAIDWCGIFATPCGFALPAGFTNAYQNVPGRTKRRGLELEFAAPINDRMTLSGNYTYTDARNPSGTRVSRVPRHEGRLALDAEIFDGLRGNIAMRHVGGRPNDSDFTVWPAASVSMPSYTVYDLSLRYQVNERADIMLRVDNLFNKQYQSEWGYGTSDRAFYLGVASRF